MSPVAQKVKRWPTNLSVLASSPAGWAGEGVEVFPTVNEVSLPPLSRYD